MLDQAATYAGSIVTGEAAPSLGLTVSLLAPARPGRFTAVGRVLRAGTSIAFLAAELFDAANLLVVTETVTSQLMPPSRRATLLMEQAPADDTI
jgi:acyl-coenzyme A thioesterase PaaI-like protein